MKIKLEIPIIDNSSQLLGIVTNRDLRFETDMTLPISSVMTKGKIVTANLTDIENAEKNSKKE